jgi:hypothetical protein
MSLFLGSLGGVVILALVFILVISLIRGALKL